MNYLEKIKQRTQVIKDTVAETITAPHIKNERMDICNKCEFLYSATMQCTKCGCFVKAKTALNSSSCPVNKWTAITIIKK